MKRECNINLLKTTPCLWDFIVIGGGATGLGIAVDAASRGFKTVLLEQSDFAKVTSGRSTKLVHGGVRYLQKGDVALVREALRERGYLFRNAPHLVSDQRFIVANYAWWERPFYTIGLTMYDLLSGKLGLGRSLPMRKAKVIQAIPQIKQKGLRGGVVYHDGRFDDARLAVNLMQTAGELGATVVNYAKVTGLLKNVRKEAVRQVKEGDITGVTVRDELSGDTFDLKGRCIVNATGIFVDDVIRMDNKAAAPMLRPSQGIHLVIDRSFLGGDDAIMIPKTNDGRVLFGVPWHNQLILGTTDTPVKDCVMEPKPLDEEIDLVLQTAAQYLIRPPKREDVLSVFAGLRPLAAPKRNANESKTKEISRRHKLIISSSGLITITGGKWTTYRQMAEETVDAGIKKCGLPSRKCMTKDLKIHGCLPNDDSNNRRTVGVADRSNRQTVGGADRSNRQTVGGGDRSNWRTVYGSDAAIIQALETQTPAYAQKLHPSFDFTVAEVVWAVREEMAITVEDVLSRRLRALILDARASMEMAPQVAAIMAQELNKDETWEKTQVDEYVRLAKGYLIS